MAGRKDKNTVDYFPHYCNSGKTLFIIESKFGNDGYAVLFKTFELLGTADNHYIDCRSIESWEFLQAKMKLMQTELQSVYDTLAKLGTIHKELWENKIIWSGNFIRNIQDVYKRRNCNCLQFYEICEHLSIKCKHKYDDHGNSVGENTQSKVEYSKVKDSNSNPEISEKSEFGSPVCIYDFETLKKELFKEIWLESIAMASYSKGISMTDLKKQLLIFCETIRDTKDFGKPIKNYQNHFVHWFQKQPGKQPEKVKVVRFNLK